MLPLKNVNTPEALVRVTATKPLPTGRQAFRHSVTVAFKRIKYEKRNLLTRYGPRYRCL